MTQRKPSLLFVLFSIVSLSLWALFIYLTAVHKQMTTIESAFFSVLNSLFTVSAGLAYSSRSTIRDYNEQRKNAALSAVRRILTIRRGIRALRGTTLKNPAFNDYVKLLYDMTDDALYDWSEVLGEELDRLYEAEVLAIEVERGSNVGSEQAASLADDDPDGDSGGSSQQKHGWISQNKHRLFSGHLNLSSPQRIGLSSALPTRLMEAFPFASVRKHVESEDEAISRKSRFAVLAWLLRPRRSTNYQTPPFM